MNTFIYYMFNTMFEISAALMYFVERKNTYAQFVNNKVKQQNSMRLREGFCRKIFTMLRACREVKWILIHLAQIYVLTFMIFPGVTNNTSLTFLESDGPWYNIFLVTTFNLFDTIGRYVGGQEKYFISIKLFYVWAWLRVV